MSTGSPDLVLSTAPFVREGATTPRIMAEVLCAALLVLLAACWNFGIGALLTGAIWAKASWGHWWVWNEPTLVSFLIVVLLFATYQPLRFAIEDPVLQGRYASVFAIIAGAFVPLNFLAVRLAQQFVHPRVLTLTGGNLPGSMRLTLP